MDIVKTFNNVYKVVSNEKFLNKETLGGEIPFYIFSYDIKLQNSVYTEINKLKNRLNQNGIKTSLINLYDVVISILQKRGVLEKLIQNESKLGKKRLLDTLSSILDVQESVVPAIVDEIKTESMIVLLYGIGEVYPYIRSHSILNNLQRYDDKPLILFFPGNYTGVDMSLFGIMKDNNYYRAFNLNTLTEVKND